MLDPDVTWRTRTPRGVVVRLGATEVASRVQHAVQKATARRVLVNGDPGIVAWNANGKPLGVMACTVADGRIIEIVSVTDPECLASMNLPAGPA